MIDPSNGPQQTEAGRTGFEWPVYADATFAGLSVLIPIPLVDMVFETLFRRRMPRRIAAYRKRALDPFTVQDLNRGDFSLLGCLFFPVWLVLVFLKRLFRTVLYFLTVKDASDKLSQHWHRAFLIDHALGRGHLDHREQATLAAQAIESTLGEITTSPVTKLAGEVVGGVKHVLRTVLRWLRLGVEDDVARAAQRSMGEHWADLGGYFDGVAQRYERTFANLMAPPRVSE